MGEGEGVESYLLILRQMKLHEAKTCNKTWKNVLLIKALVSKISMSYKFTISCDSGLQYMHYMC